MTIRRTSTLHDLIRGGDAWRHQQRMLLASLRFSLMVGLVIAWCPGVRSLSNALASNKASFDGRYFGPLDASFVRGHVGELARAERHAAVCLAGDGRLVERRDGASLRTPRRRPPGAFCGPLVCVAGRGIRNSRHNYVTVRKMKGPASLQAL